MRWHPLPDRHRTPETVALLSVTHHSAVDRDAATDTADGLPRHTDDALQEGNIRQQITAFGEETFERLRSFEDDQFGRFEAARRVALRRVR